MPRRVVEELLAVLAAHGPACLLTCRPASLAAALRAQDADAAVAAADAGGSSTAGSAGGAGAALQVTLQVATPDGTHAAQLHLLLPALYGSAGGGGDAEADADAAAQCVVTCGTQRRAWEAAASGALQARADAAAAAGRPCVNELLQALRAELESAVAAETPPPPPPQEPLPAPPAAAAPAARRVALLRLHAARDRASACRAACAWAGELRLCGRVIRYDALTLIVVEGPPEAVRAYLTRARACEEHALSVERDGESAAVEKASAEAAARAHASGSAFGGVFATAQLRSAEQLRDMLPAAGFGDWLEEQEALPGGVGGGGAARDGADDEAGAADEGKGAGDG
jgi:hypothetical protein